MTTAIEMDFFSDFAEHARADLVGAAYQIDASETPEQVCIKYFNIRKRRIGRRPRKVLLSKEIQCPPEVQAGFSEIIRKTEVGEDLLPHQSKEVLMEPEYNDQLLNHWGIQHLHLGFMPHKKYKTLVRRTKLLLFARVTDDTLYCINILEHGAWTQQQMLEIIHRNWPASIAYLRLDQAIGERLSDQDIKTLRTKNCNVALAVIDGTTYLPIGNGCSSDGTSVDVVLACARTRSMCRYMEDVIRNHLLIHLKEQGQETLGRYQFKMQIDNDQISAIDAQAGLTVKLLGASNLVL